MKKTTTKLYTSESQKPDILQNLNIAVIGYGNQGRAQALNLRDSGASVIIGNQRDQYRERAEKDNFTTYDIADAIPRVEIILLLIPDEILPGVFEEHIKPNLNQNSTLVFASGYNLTFGLLQLPNDVDAVLLAPRMIGVGVRERYLSEEGFYCLVGIEQDVSGKAEERLLALTGGIGGFHKPAIEVTFRQETILDLFNEQAFGPAFGRVLLTSISVLLEHGLPPEAVLVEMYLSEEMAYTYQKMAQIGLVRQTNFHSPTSQYGAMSRGTRFLGLGLRKRMNRIYDEIVGGSFAREWNSPFAKLRFKVIKFFAMRQSINKTEKFVRQSLGMKVMDEPIVNQEMRQILNDPRIQTELKSFEDTFKF